MTFAGVVVLGYVLGSCPWGYWLVRIFRGTRTSARSAAAASAPNVFRAYGRSLGIPVVLSTC